MIGLNIMSKFKVTSFLYFGVDLTAIAKLKQKTIEKEE